VTEAYMDQWLTGLAGAVGANVEVWSLDDEYELRCCHHGHACTIPALRFPKRATLDETLEHGLRIALLEWAKHVPDIWLRNDPRSGPTLADVMHRLEQLAEMVRSLTVVAHRS
jgi:hypothetical protein